jgi:hypothetical protein
MYIRNSTITVSMCLWHRSWIRKNVEQFAQENPQMIVKCEIKRDRHPVLIGDYGFPLFHLPASEMESFVLFAVSSFLPLSSQHSKWGTEGSRAEKM